MIQQIFKNIDGTGPDTIEYKIREIFGEIKNKFQSGCPAAITVREQWP